MRSMLSMFVTVVALGAMSATTALAYDGGIRPSSGTEEQIFEVWGTGMQPGLALDINFLSPGGTVFSTAAVGKVVVVAPDGTVSFLIRPTEVFQGESKGIWGVQACVSGTDDCDEDQFEIR